jgi:hypothetical protein
MQETMTFQLSEEDIVSAKRYGMRDALLYQICNRTGTLWRMTECGVGMEIMAPYRTLRISEEGTTDWINFRTCDFSIPHNLRVEFYPYGAPPLRDGIAGQKVLSQAGEEVTSDLVTLAR